MRWTRKSEQSQMYCGVHNYQCPLHGHSGDPWVLDVAPHLIPGEWICPQAVIEIAQFEQEAEDYKDQNSRNPEGVEFIEEDEEIIYGALRLEGADSKRANELADIVGAEGARGLSIGELNFAARCIERHQDEFGEHGERVFEEIQMKVEQCTE